MSIDQADLIVLKIDEIRHESTLLSNDGWKQNQQRRMLLKIKKAIDKIPEKDLELYKE